MNKKITVEVSDAEHLRLEKRAQERGFSSLSDYLNAVLRDEALLDFDQDWLRQQIDEGLASGDAGPLTRETLHQLVSEGVERSKRRT